jgi:hypothetical protein
MHLYNNIFYVAGASQFSHGISRASDGAYSTAPGFGTSKENVFDSNVYYGVKAPADDAHALTADPGLLDPGQGGVGRHTVSGYRLQPKSAARGNGKLIDKNGGHDFWGNAVPSCNRTDRGASQSEDCDTASHIRKK